VLLWASVILLVLIRDMVDGILLTLGEFIIKKAIKDNQSN
jgi:hypothetical protein